MLNALYIFSTLSILISTCGVLVGIFGSKFEGSAGYGGSLLFLIAAAFSIVAAILLKKQWATLALFGKIVGVAGCLPICIVVLVLFYVIFLS